MRPDLRATPVLGSVAFGALEGIVRDKVNFAVGPLEPGDLYDGAAVLAGLTLAKRTSFAAPLTYGGLFQLAATGARQLAHRAGIGGVVLPYSGPRIPSQQERAASASFRIPRGSGQQVRTYEAAGIAG